MLSPYGPVRILTYAKSLHEGGVERALLRLVRGWVEAGQGVTLVLGSAGGPHAGEIPPGVDVIVLDRAYLGLMRALPGIVRHVQPNVIFCPGNAYSGAAAWLHACLARDCPPIVAKVSNRFDRDDQHFPVRQGYRLWLRAHGAFVDHMVAMSPAMAAEAVTMTGIGADRVSVIANPPAAPATGAPTAPLSGSDYLIGIGRLSQQKRWDRAIAALADVSRRDAQLMILGEGEARPELENQIDSLGLRDRVHLPGYSTNPHVALSEARALVLTSDFEGVPGVLEEALAVGTPVVTTESSVAIREIVASPAHGSIVAPGDARGLVAALDHWLAPGRARPDPVPPRGSDSAERYIRLFENLVFDRRL
ncbi:glycosyltransferase [Sphingomonas sp.]|jgi:glycosyltransferase involved in cell wall biosynthesis|uniref:glycosyltransferase n=1 Tax=Sphingomonas sp. TaxID=28214 RepID=UPI002E34D73B|nr:glycosyltransferase [Sphingomonas sp.]HEX4694252.1 glycosyltransferase [Sphingomonas sp.]